LVSKSQAWGLLCGDDAIDPDDDSNRNDEGNFVHVWTRDACGEPLSWGHYGVVKAVNEFTQKRAIKYLRSGSQFLILKVRM